jgi:multidrug resistance efflux pump
MADNQNRKPLLIGGALLSVVVIVAIVAYLKTAGTESTDDAFIDAHIIPIGAKVAGQVQAVHVNDNQPVKADDPLVEIDPRDYDAKLAEQRAKVAAAGAPRRTPSATKKSIAMMKYPNNSWITPGPKPLPPMRPSRKNEPPFRQMN